MTISFDLTGKEYDALLMLVDRAEEAAQSQGDEADVLASIRKKLYFVLSEREPIPQPRIHKAEYQGQCDWCLALGSMFIGRCLDCYTMANAMQRAEYILRMRSGDMPLGLQAPACCHSCGPTGFTQLGRGKCPDCSARMKLWYIANIEGGIDLACELLRRHNTNAMRPAQVVWGGEAPPQCSHCTKDLRDAKFYRINGAAICISPCFDERKILEHEKLTS